MLRDSRTGLSKQKLSLEKDNIISGLRTEARKSNWKFKWRKKHGSERTKTEM